MPRKIGDHWSKTHGKKKENKQLLQEKPAWHSWFLEWKPMNNKSNTEYFWHNESVHKYDSKSFVKESQTQIDSLTCWLKKKKLISWCRKELENFIWAKFEHYNWAEHLKNLWELLYQLEMKAQLYKFFETNGCTSNDVFLTVYIIQI